MGATFHLITAATLRQLDFELKYEKGDHMNPSFKYYSLLFTEDISFSSQPFTNIYSPDEPLLVTFDGDPHAVFKYEEDLVPVI